jgi:hypothetical protein
VVEAMASRTRPVEAIASGFSKRNLAQPKNHSLFSHTLAP